MRGSPLTPAQRSILFAVVAAALGYFVDVYDLLLFTVVRVPSLIDIGVPPAQLLHAGVAVLNAEFGGMLLGGVVWGVLGDQRGRAWVLFGSIITYSVASALTPLMTSVPEYAVLRGLAGFGIAGEVGGAMTLVAEILGPRRRAFGPAIVASLGVLGAAAAVVVSRFLPWRAAYGVGAALGLGLLVFRAQTSEPAIFLRSQEAGVRRGDLAAFVRRPELGGRLLRMVVLALPTSLISALPVTFAREFGAALGLQGEATSGRAVLLGAFGFAAGDLASSLLSQLLRSRRKAILAFLVLTIAAVAVYLEWGGRSPTLFYGLYLVLGFTRGYWAVLLTATCELFGTNLRTTATTLTPTLNRGMTVLCTLLFQGLLPRLGPLMACAVILGTSLALALAAGAGLPETFGRDLDFLER